MSSQRPRQQRPRQINLAYCCFVSSSVCAPWFRPAKRRARDAQIERAPRAPRQQPGDTPIPSFHYASDDNKCNFWFYLVIVRVSAPVKCNFCFSICTSNLGTKSACSLEKIAFVRKLHLLASLAGCTHLAPASWRRRGWMGSSSPGRPWTTCSSWQAALLQLALAYTDRAYRQLCTRGGLSDWTREKSSLVAQWG